MNSQYNKESVKDRMSKESSGNNSSVNFLGMDRSYPYLKILLQTLSVGFLLFVAFMIFFLHIYNKDGKLRIGVPKGIFSPFILSNSYSDCKKLDSCGFDIESGMMISEEIDRDVDFGFIENRLMTKALNDATVDAIIISRELSKEESEKFSVSNMYFLQDAIIAFSIDKNLFQDNFSLEEKRIAYYGNPENLRNIGKWLNNNVQEFIVEARGSIESVINGDIFHNVDLVLLTISEAFMLKNINPELSYKVIDKLNSGRRLCFRKDNPIKPIIDKAILKLNRENKFRKLMTEYNLHL